MQVRDFLHPYAVRKPPQHWWCKAPLQPLKQAPQAAPKSAPKAVKKPALKAVPKAASVPAKTSSQAAAAKRLQAPVTQRGRVTKLPARLATEAAADGASSGDEAMDSTAVGRSAAAAKSPKQHKPRKSAMKPRSSKKTFSDSHVQLEAVSSQPAELANSMDDEALAAGPSVLSAAVQPALREADQPARAVPSKQRRSSVPRKGVSQLVGAGSGFLAKALGQLMDDGHLLEALQDLLAAMPQAEPAACEQSTIPLPASKDVSQAAPSNLGHSSTSVPEDKLDTEARSVFAGAAGALLGPQSMLAAKAEDHRVPALCQLGSESTPANEGQPAEADHNAKQPITMQSAAGGAPVGQVFLAKRLKGSAAVLAKVLGLNMLAKAQPPARTGPSALLSGQSPA